ncbi:acyltransferase [Rhodoferax sp. GW822-FHT02A01]|uniref:acyltransferase family protein n=1 Tax=Rhodoferax sp. GW822-FHT02A01 TaxID=3141537 RepID=UPI00315CCDDB
MVKNIQALRGIAVMLVLLSHLTVIEQKYFSGNHLLPEFLSIGISGVDIFFVISGFVMVSVTRGWHSKVRLSALFLYNRLSRIFPMYWFYSVIVLGVFWLQPTLVNSAQGNQIRIWESFLLLPLPQGTYPLLGVGWSLIHEMYFYLVFAVLLLFPQRFLNVTLCLWAVAVPLFFASQWGARVPLVQLVTHPLTCEFIAGCWIGLAATRSVLRYAKSALWLALAWWVVAYAIFATHIGWGMAPVDWRRLPVFGIPAALLCYGLVAVERAGSLLPAWLRSIGDSSYSIYLSHVLVISALGRLWGVLKVGSNELNGLALVCVFLCALIAGHISYRMLELPLHNRTRRQSIGLNVKPVT